MSRTEAGATVGGIWETMDLEGWSVTIATMTTLHLTMAMAEEYFCDEEMTLNNNEGFLWEKIGP